MSASIQISQLSKQYSGALSPALDGLTLHVESGEVYGFLGANGAGKSTTIRLLMNFLQPTSGSATIMGLDTATKSIAVKKYVGYLSGDVALYQRCSGTELLDYLSVLQTSDNHAYRKKIEQDFEAQLDKPISELSKGNRQKIGIIQALMNRPKVLILDEPTSGLDPLMQEVFYDCIRDARSHGAAILMSSHNLAEAQTICDRIGIIKHGKLIREQAIADTTAFDKPIFVVNFAQSKSVTAMKKKTALKVVSQPNGSVLRLQPTGTIAEALAELATYDIKNISTERLSLEDEFMEYYGDDT